jgi:hypothetical protein
MTVVPTWKDRKHHKLPDGSTIVPTLDKACGFDFSHTTQPWDGTRSGSALHCVNATREHRCSLYGGVGNRCDKAGGLLCGGAPPGDFERGDSSMCVESVCDGNVHKDPCKSTVMCDTGLFCDNLRLSRGNHTEDASASKGTCVPVLAPGAPCNYQWQCDNVALSIMRTDDTSTITAASPQFSCNIADADKDLGRDARGRMLLPADAKHGTCAALLSLPAGATAALPQFCGEPRARWVDGKCATAAHSCANDDDCKGTVGVLAACSWCDCKTKTCVVSGGDTCVPFANRLALTLAPTQDELSAYISCLTTYGVVDGSGFFKQRHDAAVMANEVADSIGNKEARKRFLDSRGLPDCSGEGGCAIGVVSGDSTAGEPSSVLLILGIAGGVVVTACVIALWIRRRKARAAAASNTLHSLMLDDY